MIDEIKTNTLLLKRFEVIATKAIAESEILDLPNINISTFFSHVSRHLMLELRAAVYGQVVRKIEHEHPVDWWQHFKERFFTPWMKKRWPVVMIQKKWLIAQVYPEIIAPPGKKCCQVVMYNEEVE